MAATTNWSIPAVARPISTGCRLGSMKSAEGAAAAQTVPAKAATVIPLRPRARAGRDELEFLPAALEIIETPASPVGRAIAGTIILFFVGAIVWATLGQVDIIATASGRIIPTGKIKTI